MVLNCAVLPRISLKPSKKLHRIPRTPENVTKASPEYIQNPKTSLFARGVVVFLAFIFWVKDLAFLDPKMDSTQDLAPVGDLHVPGLEDLN